MRGNILSFGWWISCHSCFFAYKQAISIIWSLNTLLDCTSTFPVYCCCFPILKLSIVLKESDIGCTLAMVFIKTEVWKQELSNSTYQAIKLSCTEPGITQRTMTRQRNWNLAIAKCQLRLTFSMSLFSKQTIHRDAGLRFVFHLF